MHDIDSIPTWIAFILAAAAWTTWFVMGSKARREARKAKQNDNAQ
jgi:hypothetical protein